MKRNTIAILAMSLIAILVLGACSSGVEPTAVQEAPVMQEAPLAQEEAVEQEEPIAQEYPIATEESAAELSDAEMKSADRGKDRR